MDRAMAEISSIPGDPPDTVMHAVQANSETAIIAFSGLKVRPGRFHLFNLVKHFPESSIVLVRDPANNWYNTGLPSIGDTVEEIAAAIDRQLTELHAKRIVAVGSSMGGYAAILFGCMLGAERVVALSPQTLLDPELPVLVPSAEVPLQVPDLKPVMHDAPQTHVELAVSWENLLDVFHAQRVADVPSARVLGVPISKHILAVELDGKGELWPFLAALFEGGTPNIAEVKPPFGAETVECLHNAILAWGRKDWKTLIREIRAVADRHPEWPAPHAALKRAIGQRAVAASGSRRPSDGV